MWNPINSGMIVSTTSSLEGWRIDQYLGPVSVHLVAGTGLMSDWFAQWSDVFGGQSQSYGRQLSGLYQEASGLLVAEARRRGATAVVGVKMDFDEVSGQGKSMFMLNAVGTAVRATRIQVEDAAGPAGAEGVLAADDMAVLLRKNQVLRAVAARTLRLDSETWEFITQHRIAECASFVLGAYLDARHFEDRAHFEPRARLYFARLAPEASRPPLYRGLVHTGHESSPYLNQFSLSLIRELRLFDYGEITRLLSDPRPEVRVRAVAALSADPEVYGAEDVAVLERLRDLLVQAFPPVWTPVRGQGLFGGEKEGFQCECGKRVRADATHCPSCQRDRHGFRKENGSLEAALADLDARLDVLRARFGTAAAV